MREAVALADIILTPGVLCTVARGGGMARLLDHSHFLVATSLSANHLLLLSMLPFHETLLRRYNLQNHHSARTRLR